MLGLRSRQKVALFQASSHARESEKYLQQIPEQNIPADEPNWWGALNTITCWVDHLQETESDRYTHSLLGSGDTLKSRALAMAESEVGQV
jgi:hypothetical protein